MYIERLKLTNIRTFVKNELEFVHPDKAYRPPEQDASVDKNLLPKPRLRNVNLLLGDNGSGKSTILRAIALSAFGPAAAHASLSDNSQVRWGETKASMEAAFLMHEQDDAKQPELTSLTNLTKKGELELTEFPGDGGADWARIYESSNDAFFVVGYGATRRVERAENLDMGARTKKSFARAQRVQSLFEDFASLIPLSYWLPQEHQRNPGRYKQVVNLMNRLLKPGGYEFTAKQGKSGDFLFTRGGMPIPFQNLSDGYRAFIGWVADLLYHVCFGAPSGKKLVEGRGIVLVDEIDLHLHPKWQMQVIETVANAFPHMQFVFTSHSPLVAGSLEWMNIITLKAGAKTNRTIAKRLKQSIHGLDADQILLTDFFGLSTTSAPAKKRQLAEISSRIRTGDKDAPLQLIRAMSSGTEVEE